MVVDVVSLAVAVVFPLGAELLEKSQAGGADMGDKGSVGFFWQFRDGGPCVFSYGIASRIGVDGQAWCWECREKFQVFLVAPPIPCALTALIFLFSATGLCGAWVGPCGPLAWVGFLASTHIPACQGQDSFVPSSHPRHRQPQLM
jgi:hypothetical protein